MKRIHLLFALVLLAAVPAAGGISWDPLPGTTLSGAPGDVLGWGYNITNGTSYWLAVETLTLSVPFAVGSDVILINNSLANMPVLAPGASLSPGVTFDQATAMGLLQLTLGTSLLPATDSGNFILTFGEYDTDPFGTGTLQATEDVARPFVVSVIPPPPAAIPEPSTA